MYKPSSEWEASPDCVRNEEICRDSKTIQRNVGKKRKALKFRCVDLCVWGAQHNFILFHFVHLWRTLPPNSDVGTWFSSLCIQFWKDFWVFLLHHYMSAALICRPGWKKQLSPTSDMKNEKRRFLVAASRPHGVKKTKQHRSVCESVSVPLCVPEVKRGNLSPNAWRILLAMGTEELLGNISLSFQHLLSVSSSHSI